MLDPCKWPQFDENLRQNTPIYGFGGAARANLFFMGSGAEKRSFFLGGKRDKQGRMCPPLNPPLIKDREHPKKRLKSLISSKDFKLFSKKSTFYPKITFLSVLLVFLQLVNPMQANGVVYDPKHTCLTRGPPNMTLLHQSVANWISF